MKMIAFGSVLLAMMAVACGGAGDKESVGSNAANLKVSGTVARAGRSLDNASAVAIGSDGRTFSAYLDRNGKFSLELPVGHVYRVIIANGTMSGGLHPVGHLVNATSKGNADQISVKKGGSLDLGNLRPAGTSAGTIQPKCGCSADEDQNGSSTGSSSSKDGSSKGSSDSSDDYPYPADAPDNGDYDTTQKDGDKDRVCEDTSSDVDLVADNAPGDKCAKDEDESDAPKPSSKACDDGSSKSGEASGPSDDDGKSDDGSADTTDSSEDDGTYDPKAGSKSAGEACTCSSQCEDACVAGKCTGTSSSGGDTKSNGKK